MVEVSAFRTRCGAPGPAEFAVYRNKVDQRRARAQLDQAYGVFPAFHAASKHTAIEAEHAVQVRHAQDDMVDTQYTEH
jgi:hypothetical protein